MKPSESSPSTSKSDPVQLPLKGFRVPLKGHGTKHEMTIEGMGDGRYRVHVTPKR